MCESEIPDRPGAAAEVSPCGPDWRQHRQLRGGPQRGGQPRCRCRARRCIDGRPVRGGLIARGYRRLSSGLPDGRLPLKSLQHRSTRSSPSPGRKRANRALLCATLAEGTSTFDNLPDGDDTEAMLTCLDCRRPDQSQPRRNGLSSRARGDIRPADRVAHSSRRNHLAFVTALLRSPGAVLLDGHQRCEHDRGAAARGPSQAGGDDCGRRADGTPADHDQRAASRQSRIEMRGDISSQFSLR